ncbi:histone deacetylase complex subunit SAP18-like [Uloborus diversus]|uniref:histone deacetylase complex subunit SAP18-like n=1 Tax=Uloborus diversus TaxID=327109 RepID=UPI00240A1359|nr:histone deacetylase complex subunit SAP18-like [Uloborus diversus]
MESVVENKPDSEKPIDREKTCPLLLRVFVSPNKHHGLSEFSRGKVPVDELQIYTWMDASLKELTSLVCQVKPQARRAGTRFEFAVVYLDPRVPLYRMRDIGGTVAGQRGGPDDAKTLASVRFKIGDFLDVSITPPEAGMLGRRAPRLNH